MIAVEVTFATPYAIFIFQQYGASIPYELDEAARIDGASPPQIFFRIYLPLLEEAGAGDAPLPQSAAPVRWRGSGTVLLVEDEPMVRGLASTMLQRLGFEVVEAADGMEGVARYRERAAGFSLVVTDLGMPVMDGYQMLRELKRLDLAIPVVITTGFGDVDVASRISGAEFAGFLGKPYNFSQLEVVVRRVMDPAAPAPAG